MVELKRNLKKMVETRVMHHDLFNEVEQLLFENKLAIDINEEFSADQIPSQRSDEVFRDAYYIRCNGWCLIEDYDRMKFIAKSHNKIIQFIQNSALSNIKDSPKYIQMKDKLDEMNRDAKNEKDRNKRFKIQTQIKALKDQLEKMTQPSLDGVDQWIIDGFESWVDTFMQDARYFYTYPFGDDNPFHVKANLKKDCFLDSDLRAVDYAFTSRPNVRLSLFGLVTSVPQKEKYPFDPMKEFKQHEALEENNDPVGFESAMRGLFRGFDGLDGFSKFNRYPNLNIYPIAVFREIIVK